MFDYNERDEYFTISTKCKKYSELIKHFSTISSQNEKIRYAEYLVHIALSESMGNFYSPEIENFYLSLSEDNQLDNYDITPIKNSVLHIASEIYTYGGHSRVIERWIKSSPENQTHSFVLTNIYNNDFITDRLKSAVDKSKGKVHIIDGDLDIINRSLELRKIAMKYEKVILHVHNDDPTPIIAFGTESFTRPVIFYNHSSHYFWLGVSISDVVAELMTIAKDTSIRRRGVTNSVVLGIPTELKANTPVNKDQAFKELGIPSDKIIIFTGGGISKLRPFCEWNYNKIVLPILDIDDNCIVIIVGNKPSSTQWKLAKIKYGDRLQIFPTVEYDLYQKYLVVSDIVVDSMPVSGGTALMDAIMHDKPVLSLDNPIGQLDYLVESDSYCTNIKDFKYKLNRLVADKNFRSEFAQNTKNMLLKFQSNQAWKDNVNSIYENLPSKHRVRRLEEAQIPSKFYREDLGVWIILGETKECKKYFGIRYLFEFIKTKKNFSCKVKEARLFSITILKIVSDPLIKRYYLLGVNVYNSKVAGKIKIS